jgi:hypothetical protein
MAFRKSQPKPTGSPSTSLEFYSHLKWLDSTPSMLWLWLFLPTSLTQSNEKNEKNEKF